MNLKIMLIIMFSMLVLLLLAIAPTENSSNNNSFSIQTEAQIKYYDETVFFVFHFNKNINNSSRHNQFKNLSSRFISNCKDFTVDEKPADKKICIKNPTSKLLLL
jgi:hypothetical protein